MIIDSFDIFDTVLSRAIPGPVDIFKMMYHDALREYPALASIDREEFVWSRQLSEKRALDKSNSEETRLDDISSELAQIFPFLDPDRIAEIELTVERQLLFPVYKTASLINAKREGGHRIIFISDTYLPESFLEGLLEEHGLLESSDKLYVSSSLLLTKRTGSMYPYVLNDLNADPSSVWHHGDNKWSDITQASRHGINTVWIQESFATNHERQILNRTNTASLVGPILVGLSKHFRLSNNSCCYSALVGQFLGPLSILMALWVIRRAKHKGASMTLFCSRDMFLTWRAAAKIAKTTKLADVRGLRYFLVSRQSLYLQSLAYSNTLKDWIIRPCDQNSPLSVAKKLGFSSVEELGPVSRNIVNAICNDCSSDEADQLCNALVKEPEVKASFTQAADNLLSYLNKLGLAKVSGAICIADIGWTKTSQRYLHNTVRHGLPASDNKLHGLYLGLNNTRKCSSDFLSSEAIFYQPMHQEAGDYFHPNSRATLLEHLIGLPAHPKVITYDEKGNPVFDKVQTEPSRRRLIKSAHISHSRYLRGIDKIGHYLSLIEDSEIRASIRILIECFFREPDAKTARELSSVLVSGDQNDLAQRRACSPISLKEAIFFYRVNQSHPWPEASLAISSLQSRIICSLSKKSYSFYRRARGKARQLLSSLKQAFSLQ